MLAHKIKVVLDLRKSTHLEYRDSKNLIKYMYIGNIRATKEFYLTVGSMTIWFNRYKFEYKTNQLIFYMNDIYVGCISCDMLQYY